jgi:hypothetical protein
VLQKALSRANKKTVMLNGFIGLRPEKGGISVQCELAHIEQTTDDRRQTTEGPVKE